MFRESGYHRNCCVADPVCVSWGSLQDGQKSRPFERQFVGTPANAQNHGRDKPRGDIRSHAWSALAWVPPGGAILGFSREVSQLTQEPKTSRNSSESVRFHRVAKTLPNTRTMLSLPSALAGKPLQIGQNEAVGTEPQLTCGAEQGEGWEMWNKVGRYGVMG